MSDDWCTIESDPGVFTELLESVGVPHVELQELWSMDDDSLAQLQKSGEVYGFIFLFKWKPGTSTDASSTGTTNRTPMEECPSDLFFAHQVTTNACATQALLSVVLNKVPSENLGETLTEFKSFTSDFPPSLKGEAIGASEELKKAHNSFARKDAFLQEGKTHVATGDEDVFHFVAYIPHKDNKVYELDGLQSGPIVIGDIPENQDWMTVARTAIQERMNALSGEIKFNLLAVMNDKRVGLQEKLATLKEDSEEYNQVQAELHAEHAKRQDWKLENERRRHNYVPLCMQLLKELAASGSLPQLTTEANERVQAKRAKAMEKS